ncbi:ParA family protein [Hyphomicrobium sp.]|uniref:ParA family protein n=1 Tax=Hyphomicrobium sp. TaxID=82 RepID=UPI002D7858CF|nr:ParA family protein [Hyphomicrobium sp.]HET6388712.1 ParA family protein [Hyphomicrobium sp.]
MSVTVAIANPKGGVGKSLTTMMLADGLALSYEARVLVLDADPQAGITKALLGIDAEQQLQERKIGLAAMLEAFASGRSMRMESHRVVAGDLIELRDRQAGFIDILPSNHELLKEMAEFEHVARRKKRKDRLDVLLSDALRSELSKIEQHYDAVLIDCPAGPGVLGLAAMRLAPHILTPTSLETNAYSTLTDFLKFILADDLNLASQVKVHPLITQYQATNTLQREMLNHIKQGLHQLNAISRPVPYTSALQNAATHPGLGVYRSARDKYGSALPEVLALTKAVVERLSGQG